MVTSTITLQELIGATIQNIGTIREDEDGDDMVYFYLDTGVTIGADRPNLWALTESQFSDVFVDFTDFLERDSPHDEDDWHDRVGTFLLLADLIGQTFQAVTTQRVDGVRWIYLKLTDDCTLAVPFSQLVADGEYTQVWKDARDLEEPEGTPHGTHAAINRQ